MYIFDAIIPSEILFSKFKVIDAGAVEGSAHTHFASTSCTAIQINCSLAAVHLYFRTWRHPGLLCDVMRGLEIIKSFFVIRTNGRTNGRTN